MDFNGDMKDQFPPIFNQFREFFEEQQKDLFEDFQRQRTEMNDNFVSIIGERNEMIEKNLSMLSNLNAEIDEMKNREVAFERENGVLKTEFEKTKKALIETKEELQQFENQENLEIEELERKQKIAIGLVDKLRNNVKDQEFKALEDEEQNKL